jgi:hypothetical protein
LRLDDTLDNVEPTPEALMVVRIAIGHMSADPVLTGIMPILNRETAPIAASVRISPKARLRSRNLKRD